MIHCMSDCVDKLRTIKKMAQVGISESTDQPERNRFEQISMEVSYLIVEAESDDNSGNSFLRNYAKDWR